MTDAATPTALTRERLRPTRRAALLGVLGVLLYGAGANVSAGWVVVVAAVALGAIPWAVWTAARAARTVRVERILPREATAGADVRVRLTVRGPVAAMAVVHDGLTRTVGVAAGLRDGVDLEGIARLPRGVLRGGPVRVELSDPFGLVTATCVGDVPAAGLVLPSVPTLRSAGADAAWAVEAGTRSVRAGHGSETIGVREYRSGDPIRGVHWRSTARRGQLVVRELAEPSRPRVDVVIEPGAWDPASMDRATEVAAAVAADAAAHGHPTTVAVDGERAPWHDGLLRRLATLPPHAGAPARPLAPVQASGAEVVVTIAPTPEGPLVTRTSDGDRQVLGVVPSASSATEVGSWLTLRLERSGAASGASS